MSAGPPPVPLMAYSGSAFRVVPGRLLPAYNRLVSIEDGGHWHDPGRPTLYLASDAAVAIAELGRRMAIRSGELTDTGLETLFRLRVRVEGIADIRSQFTLAALGLPGGAAELRDRAAARAIGRRMRDLPGCRGMLVPSLAFLDEPKRALLVIFVDHLVSGLQSVLWQPSPVAELRFAEETAP